MIWIKTRDLRAGRRTEGKGKGPKSKEERVGSRE